MIKFPNLSQIDFGVLRLPEADQNGVSWHDKIYSIELNQLENYDTAKDWPLVVLFSASDIQKKWWF